MFDEAPSQQTFEEFTKCWTFLLDEPDLQFVNVTLDVGVSVEFENEDALILTSGDDTDAIRVSTAVDLIQKAQQIQTQTGQAAVQRMHASASALWQPVIGQVLQAVRLSKNDDNMFLNDALLLDFGEVNNNLLVTLNPTGGLALSRH